MSAHKPFTGMTPETEALFAAWGKARVKALGACSKVQAACEAFFDNKIDLDELKDWSDRAKEAVRARDEAETLYRRSER